MPVVGTHMDAIELAIFNCGMRWTFWMYLCELLHPSCDFQAGYLYDHSVG
jgi:hypothetical protein